jgi:predicted phosphodiesterase
MGYMKIVYTSDSHWGITKPEVIEKMFREIVKEKPDLFIHLGDYCGTFNGADCVRKTVKAFRQHLPDTPYISVIGNHDYWCSQKGKKYPDGELKVVQPSIQTAHKNLQEIIDTFKEFNVHFLDKDGIYCHPQFPQNIFFGHSGWYAHPNPPTNDHYHLPRDVEGNTNAWMLKQVNEDLDKTLLQLDNEVYDGIATTIFCSHFPVVNTGSDYDGRFKDFSWSESIKEHMEKYYDTKYFINGHSHQLHEGPVRYEAGSDYGNPQYAILEL